MKFLPTMDKKRQLALDQLKMSKRSKVEEDIKEEEEDSSADDDDAECAICGSGNCTSKNPIVLCDGEDCDIPLHKSL
jgi:hypothetical protein